MFIFTKSEVYKLHNVKAVSNQVEKYSAKFEKKRKELIQRETPLCDF